MLFTVNVVDGCLATTFTSTPPFNSPFIFDIAQSTAIIGSAAFTQSKPLCPPITYDLLDNSGNTPNIIFG